MPLGYTIIELVLPLLATKWRTTDRRQVRLFSTSSTVALTVASSPVLGATKFTKKRFKLLVMTLLGHKDLCDKWRAALHDDLTRLSRQMMAWERLYLLMTGLPHDEEVPDID